MENKQPDLYGNIQDFERIFCWSWTENTTWNLHWKQSEKNE